MPSSENACVTASALCWLSRMSEGALRKLGFSKGIIEHLLEYQPSAPLGHRVQPAMHWQSSPIAHRQIIALWECGTVLTYFDESSAKFRKCSLEDINDDWFSIAPSKLF